MVAAFWKNRRQRTDLQFALERDLERLPRPTKRGRTIDEYFAAAVQFVQDYCRHKIHFITAYESREQIRFSAGYRRRYLAKAFDSLVQDLHRIVTEYLEIDFVITLHRAVDDLSPAQSEFPVFWEHLEALFTSKAEHVLESWYDEPLRRFLEKILNQGDFNDQRREQLWQAHEKAYAKMQYRSRRLIGDFCDIADAGQSARRFAQILEERKSQFPHFLKELEKQGFQLPLESANR